MAIQMALGLLGATWSYMGLLLATEVRKSWQSQGVWGCLGLPWAAYGNPNPEILSITIVCKVDQSYFSVPRDADNSSDDSNHGAAFYTQLTAP